MEVSSKRHYCCICSNYGGKLIDGKYISLHRFPANKALQRAWLRRIRVVSSTFQFHEKNDRLCSVHFKDNKYVKGKSVPSIFTLSDGRINFFDTDVVNNEDVLTYTPDATSPADVASQDKDIPVLEQSEVGVFISSVSSLTDSILLHDYCGPVEAANISRYVDKCEQTCVCCTQTTEISTQTEGNSKSSVSASCQTDETVEVKTFSSIGIQVNRPNLSFEDISSSDEKCMFYTGIPNAKIFQLLFDEMDDAEEHTHRAGSGDNSGTGRPRILRLIDEFSLVLMRLRLGLLLEDLADRFHISKSTCSNITNYWISYLHVKLASLIPWPSKLVSEQTMPNKFKVKYPDCRIIIDCTEIFTETPQSQRNKILMYSHYKSHMTYKALIGISPSGVINICIRSVDREHK